MSEPTKILSIDDNVLYLRLIEKILKTTHWNYDLIFATDGADAIDEFDRIAPDLVIVDVNLPSRDGYAICRHIRTTRGSSCPILAVSGDSEGKVKSVEAGATRFVDKPFTRRDLLSALEHIYPPFRQRNDVFDGK